MYATVTLLMLSSLCATTDSPIAPAALLPAPLKVAPANPLLLKWSVGLRGGTVQMTMENNRPTFTRQGGVEHFAEVAAVLHPDLLSAREEAPPTGPHLALVVSETPGTSVATFVVSGSGGQQMAPTRAEGTDVKFWSPADEATFPDIVPTIGEWLGSGTIPLLHLRARNIPLTVSLPWHVGKQTVVLGAGVTVTTYFINHGV